jgi:hypothetical protein
MARLEIRITALTLTNHPRMEGVGLKSWVILNREDSWIQLTSFQKLTPKYQDCTR